MIRLEDRYARDLSIADGYKKSFIVEEYKTVHQDERDEI